jgi:hypothetical protein
MSATSAAWGLRPVRHRDGSVYNGAVNMYYVPSTDATALYIGDPVQLAGNADAQGISTVARATAGAGNPILGVVVGFIPLDPIPATKYRAASTAQYVLVNDNITTLYAVQEDSVGGVVAAASVGLNIDLVSASGSTYTGLSGWMGDSSTVATGATLQCKLEGIDAGSIGDAYQTLLVSLNNAQHASGVAGIA